MRIVCSSRLCCSALGTLNVKALWSLKGTMHACKNQLDRNIRWYRNIPFLSPNQNMFWVSFNHCSRAEDLQWHLARDALLRAKPRQDVKMNAKCQPQPWEEAAGVQPATRVCRSKCSCAVPGPASPCRKGAVKEFLGDQPSSLWSVKVTKAHGLHRSERRELLPHRDLPIGKTQHRSWCTKCLWAPPNSSQYKVLLCISCQRAGSPSKGVSLAAIASRQ